MQKIKTITATTAYGFDTAVNEALTEGWVLVRRECFITGSDRAATFYAEFERFSHGYRKHSEVEQLKAENAKLLKALRIHGGCSACVHQKLKEGCKTTYRCDADGCNRNGNPDRWEWRCE